MRKALVRTPCSRNANAPMRIKSLKYFLQKLVSSISGSENSTAARQQKQNKSRISTT